MDKAQKIKDFLTKLQNLPDKQKKVILWSVVIFFGLIMGAFWINGTINRFSKIGEATKSVNIPSLNLPSTDLLQTTTPSTENPVVQTDKTTDWKTYTSDKYGFEIKYPANKQCEFTGDDNGNFNLGRIEMSVLDSGGLDLNNFIDKYLSQNADTFGSIYSREQTNIDSKQAVKVTYSFGGSGRYGEATFLENKTNIYIIGYTAGVFNCNELDIFPQMISTFKFTK